MSTPEAEQKNNQRNPETSSFESLDLSAREREALDLIESPPYRPHLEEFSTKY